VRYLCWFVTPIRSNKVQPKSTELRLFIHRNHHNILDLAVHLILTLVMTYKKTASPFILRTFKMEMTFVAQFYGICVEKRISSCWISSLTSFRPFFLLVS
jgi:hypothetical protein